MECYHEKVQLEEGIPARICRGGGSQLHYPLHWHDQLEFDLVLDGAVRGKVNGVEQAAGRGEIFFVNSGELHETEGSERSTLRSVTLLLSDSLLREYCPEFGSAFFAFGKGSSQEKRIAALVEKCAEVYEQKPDYYGLELSVLLRQICLILLRECRCEKPEAEPGGTAKWKNTKRVKQAISYMETNYQNSLSIREMGEVMGMTPAYFSRFFKYSTGETFHSYLSRIRVCHAQRELMAGDASVTEIAMDTGFPNVKSFIETFKREYQMTPALYRRRMEP